MRKIAWFYGLLMGILIGAFIFGIKNGSYDIQVITLQCVVVLNLLLLFRGISWKWLFTQIFITSISLVYCYQVYFVSARISRPASIEDSLVINESAVSLWFVEVAPFMYSIILVLIVGLTVTTCNKLSSERAILIK
jgi:hypothetical protein